MNKTITLAAFLIGLLLVLAFYVGATNVLSTGGGVLNTLFLTLQGREAQGNFASYPGGATPTKK